MAEFMDLETFSPNWELISLESSDSDHESGNLEADCNELIRATTPENSTKAEKLHINKLKTFLKEKDISLDLATCSHDELASALKQFYFDLKKKDGSLYKPGTLGCIRAGIQRHLQAPPLNRPINLCLDPAFMTANKVLNAKAKLYLKNPQATKTAHKRDICDADLLLIGNFLKSNVFECPSYLQLGVWFLSAYLWGKRGCEQWRLISKSDIEFDADERGEFVTLCNRRALIAKNYKRGLKKSDVDNADSPKLYNLKDVSVSPYNIIKTYVEKLPASGPLFSTADDKRFKLTNKWYLERPCGKNTINNFMKRLSSVCCLSKLYTNHCVGRSTVITVLGEAGFSEEQIVQLTRHKNPQVVREYLGEKIAENLTPVMQKELISRTDGRRTNPGRLPLAEAHSSPSGSGSVLISQSQITSTVSNSIVDKRSPTIPQFKLSNCKNVSITINSGR